MKKILFISSILCAAAFSLLGDSMNNNTPPARLILRADDMGSSHSANIASLESACEGIATCIEVMPVCSWFPEAVQLLRQYPTIDVGIHLTLTSEWDKIKWRPLTKSPSLTDSNGYFFPKVFPDKNYPNRSLIDPNRPLNLAEAEAELRAQIELALREIPQISHLSAHMGFTGNKELGQLVQKLAEEYNLPCEADTQNLNWIGYKGPHGTPEEKIESFEKMIHSLQPGKTYLFLDHPALNNLEMQGFSHIGYENVATDRQGVTDLFKSPASRQLLEEKNIITISMNTFYKSLPRATPEELNVSPDMLSNYLAAVKEKKQNIHSIMVLRKGHVVAEHWMQGQGPEIPHVMYSVSKTFTATAIGFAVQEGLLKVTDQVISFFPDDLPSEVSPFLEKLRIQDLLSMTVGQEKDSYPALQAQPEGNWQKIFLSLPIKYEPGSRFLYNTGATYMLSCILQKVTGQKVIDYLYPRLFRPLGITGARWEESPQGINCGGWGLWIKTEDMAKFGQFLLQKGAWNGKQLLNQEWIETATTEKIRQNPNATPDELASSDWLQGYCYQMWRCRHNAFRADGAAGQFIVIIPDKEAVVAITADLSDMQSELNLVWEHILPALK